MIKRDVIDNPESCFNTAYDQEHLFVFLSRDPAAPAAIRAWIAERLRLGRNKPGDEQIREAYECATLMELQRSEITSARSQQQLPWADGREGGPIKFTISQLTSVLDLEPRRETLSWLDFTTLLSEPDQSPCTRQTCLKGSCPHKRGRCWAPAVFHGDRRPKVDALSLLVFDVEELPDDQVDEIAKRLSSLQYLMHSTHSDTPDSRCLRIVIALSRPVSAPLWKTFFRTALQSLVPEADPASADEGRLYFIPSRPRGCSYFTQVNTGRPLDVDALLASPEQAPINSNRQEHF